MNPQYSVIISPDSHFKNMFLVEVGRGCGRHCHFCAASYIYHPFRYFSIENILKTVHDHNLGASRVGLVGAAISDYPQLHQLCCSLVEEGYELGLSSFRLDMLNPDFLKILERGKVRSISLAPEAGSEALRHKINKHLSHNQIIESVHFLADSIIDNIKLYFLIGLPGESWDDIDAIVDLVEEIHQIFFKKGANKKITVSINAFIPKPWTPFQWAPMERRGELQKKRKHLETRLKKMKAVTVSQKSGKAELLQGMLSLGDEKVGMAVYHKINQRLQWNDAWKKAGVDVESLLHQPRRFDQQF
ncbi:MAG: radical SAM protein, partial [bacterium]|nr:radical SAM protein [bacterium]